MKKTFLSVACGVAIALSLAVSPAKADGNLIASTFTSVDDVSSSLFVPTKGTVVSTFITSSNMDMVIALERASTPAGLSWQVISGLGDIAPTATDTDVQTAIYVTAEANELLRLRVVTDTAGTAFYVLVGGRSVPTDISADRGATYCFFDDMFFQTAPVDGGTIQPGNYLVFIGAGNAAVIGLPEDAPEGVLTWSSGDAGDDTDLSVWSMSPLGDGALVSAGAMTMQWRLHLSQITDGNAGVGLIDTIAASTEMEPFKVNTNVIAEGAVTTMQNGVAIIFSTDADDDVWQLASANANTQGNNADEFELGIAPAVTTYQTFRIEIDTNGDAYVFIDGLLVGAEKAAVATTAVLLPYGWLGSATDASGTVVKANLDYIEFCAARPTS